MSIIGEFAGRLVMPVLDLIVPDHLMLVPIMSLRRDSGKSRSNTVPYIDAAGRQIGTPLLSSLPFPRRNLL
jgi:hypothetical protein